MSHFRGVSDNESAYRRTNPASDLPKPRPLQEIYNTLTGRGYTRLELVETLPIRLIAVFQTDSSLLLEPYSSEWMANRWQSIVDLIEVRGNTPQGGSAIVHLADDNLDDLTPNQSQLQQLIKAAQVEIVKAGHKTP